MRITVIRHSIRQRGGDKVILDYLNFLAARGHQIDYWVNEIDSSLFIDKRIRMKKIPYPGTAGTLWFALKNHFDSIVFVDLAVMAVCAGRANRDRLIYISQDWDVSYYKNSFLRELTATAYRLVMDSWRVKTIAVSEQLAEVLRQYKPKAMKMVPNGIDLTIFHRNLNSPQLALRNKKKVVLLFARTDHRKGLDIGLAALNELKAIRSENDYELWLIGEQIPPLGGIETRHFGFVRSDEQLRDILSAVDIYLVPTRSEGLSLLLLQAMACHCAVVTTSACSVVQNGVHGLVSPLEDFKALANNLDQLLSRDDLRAKFADACGQLSKNYDVHQSSLKIEALMTDWENA